MIDCLVVSDELDGCVAVSVMVVRPIRWVVSGR